MKTSSAFRSPLSRLAAFLFILCCIAGSLSSTAYAADATRPNIIFIFSDDHAWQAISAYNPKLLHTPNIDRLAEQGMRFDRCLVPNSICGPSRASWCRACRSRGWA